MAEILSTIDLSQIDGALYGVSLTASSAAVNLTTSGSSGEIVYGAGAPLKYNIIENNGDTYCEVAGYGNRSSSDPYNVIIPDEYDGYPIRGIAAEAFMDEQSTVNYLVVGKNVEYIGAHAFSEVHGSMYVSFAADENNEYKLRTIGAGAFYCTNVPSITLPDSVTSIGDGAFSECAALATFTISGNSNLETIGQYVFENCTALTTINIPNGVTSIGDGAFSECEQLVSFTINYSGSSLKTIGNGAFEGTAIRDLTLPAKLESIGRNAFNASSIEDVNIPESLITIGTSAFENCVNLERIVFPAQGCNITEIPERMCYCCNALTDVCVYPIVKYDDEDEAYDGHENALPSSVTTIGKKAFEDTAITEITIPSSVNLIGAAAFAGSLPFVQDNDNPDNNVISKVHFNDPYGWFTTAETVANPSVFQGGTNYARSVLAGDGSTAANSLSNDSTNNWYKIDQLPAPTLEIDGDNLIITDATGLAEKFHIYISGTYVTTYVIANGTFVTDSSMT